MNLAFLNIGGMEIVLIIIVFLLIIAVGNYGRNTALGYWGSVLVAILTSPLIAFLIIAFLRYRQKSNPLS